MDLSKDRGLFYSILIIGLLLNISLVKSQTSYKDLFPTIGKVPADLTYQCHAGWHKENDYCYRLYTVPQSSESAAKTCSNEGGRLANVAELGDRIFVADTLVISEVLQYWIDGDCMVAINDAAQDYPMSSMPCNDYNPFLCIMDAWLDTEIKCLNQKHVKAEYKCDGDNDCGDFSDELDCPNLGNFKLTVDGDEGRLESPQYPSYYNNKQDITWVLCTPVGTRVQLEFESFNTEETYDTFKIYIGGSTLSTAEFLGTLSGTKKNGEVDMLQPFISTNNYMIAVFTSDTTDSEGRNNVPNSDLRFLARFFPSDIIPNTRQQLTATNAFQTFTSPLYGVSNYPAGTILSYIITTEQIYGVTTLMWLDIHLALDDTITVFDGADASSRKLVEFKGKIEGNAGEEEEGFVTSSGRDLFILMNAKSLNGAPGFRFSYKSGCDLTLTRSYGKISSVGFPYSSDLLAAGYSYPKLVSCTYTIQLPDSGKSLAVYFEYKDLETNGDTLQLSLDDEAPVNSLTAGSTYSAAGGKVTLTFTSDAVYGGAGTYGFIISYSRGCASPGFNEFTNTPVELSTQYTSQFSVTCQEGYYFSQKEFEQCGNSPIVQGVSVDLECGYKGQWNVSRLPNCEPVYCVNIPSIDNGYINNFTSAQFGGSVNYDCFSGFVLNGAVSSNCQADGEWTAAPTCRAAQCPEITSTNNTGGLIISIINKDGREYGSVVSFDCEPGYELTVGQPIITCYSNATWSGAIVVECSKRSCLVPHMPHMNGSFNEFADTPVQFGDQVTLDCLDGYVIDNTTDINHVLTCMEDLTFGDIPMCLNKDECEGDPCDAGVAVCQDTVGSYLCMCPAGYTRSLNGLGCEDINECTTGISGCDSDCNNIPGSYECSCPSGMTLYTMDGTNGFDIRTPAEDGLGWDDVYQLNHTCVFSTCPHPTANVGFNNGHLMQYETASVMPYFYVGDSVKLLCDIGYGIEGVAVGSNPESMVMTCQVNGQWDTPAKNCTRISCAQLDSQSDYPGAFVNQPDFYGMYTAQVEVPYGGQVLMNCTVNGGTPPNIMRTRTCMYDVEDGRYLLKGDPIDCPVIDCGRPVVGGLLDANYPTEGQTYYSDTFEFECKPGFNQHGNTTAYPTTVMCMENGQWNLGNLRCEGDSCDDPGTPPDGQQTGDSYDDGAQVTFTCDRSGYAPNHETLTCTSDGVNVLFKAEISSQTTPTVECLDIEDPVITNCPTEMQYVKRFSALTFDPEYNDNSGFVNTLSSDKYLSEVFSEEMLVTTQVTITAADLSTNQDTCTVNVTVINELPPTFPNGCPASAIIYLNTDDENRMVDVASEYGANVTGASSLEVISSFEPVSVTVNKAMLYKQQIITQTASDMFGNKATCTFTMVVMPAECATWHLSDLAPTREFSTLIFENDTRATLQINSGYTFYETGSALLEYNCVVGVGFTNEVYGTSVPQPVAYSDANYRQIVKFDYRGVVGTSFNREAVVSYVDFFEEALPSFQIDLENQVATVCRDNNIFISLIFNDTAAVESSSSQSVKPELTVVYDVSQDTGFPHLQTCASFIEAAIEGTLNQNTLGLQQLVPNGLSVIGANTIEFPVNKFTCLEDEQLQQYIDPLTLLQRSICTQCAPGFYWNGVNCSICAVGTYQDVQGQTSCINCLGGKNTYGEGAFSEAQCHDECQAPLSSANGLAPCTACPQGQYWTSPTGCSPCNGLTITHGPQGVINSSYCYPQCVAGYFNPDQGFESAAGCRACPKGYYNEGPGSDKCLMCAHDKTTMSIGSTALSDCIGVADNASLCDVCVNATGCTIDQHQIVCACTPGFNGTYCDMEINECDSSPCYYGGNCIDGINSFTCECTVISFADVETLSGKIPLGVFSTDILEKDTADACKQAAIDDETSSGTVFTSTGTGETPNTLCERYADPFINFDDSVTVTTFRRFTNESLTYGGSRCEVEPDNCVNNNCQNGGKCKDLVGGYKCICPNLGGFTGEFCTETTPICENSPCMKGGSCVAVAEVRFYCQCVDGYTGDECQINIDNCDPDPCYNGATCTDGVDEYSCGCATGFTGDNCEVMEELCTGSPCTSNGQCVQDYREPVAVCNCKDGYTSEQYNSARYSSTPTSEGDIESINFHNGGRPCGGDTVVGAECYVVSDDIYAGQLLHTDCGPEGLVCYNANLTGDAVCEDYSVSYICQVSGSTCHELDECTEYECENGASCTDQVDDYSCSCPAGYSGSNCQTDIDECLSSPCHNGTCHTFPSILDHFNCTCFDGYEGTTCETNINECAPGPCVASGTASCKDLVNDFMCECRDGYRGKNCSVDIDECLSDPCLNGATCADVVNGYTCACAGGWEGTHCGEIIEYCSDDVCENGGTCFDVFGDFYCSCAAGFSGRNCGEGPRGCTAANPCRNGGTCDDSTGTPMCTCPDGFTGDGCQCERDYCNPDDSICQNDGICTVEGLGNYSCQCIPGYTGRNCDVNPDDCNAMMCGDGVCIDGVDGTSCSCPAGKVGPKCLKERDSDFDLHFGIGAKSSSLTPFLLNVTDFTLSFWVRIIEAEDGEPFFKIYSVEDLTSANRDEAIITIDNTGMQYTYDSNMSPFASPSSFNDTEWHLITVTFDSTEASNGLIKVYEGARSASYEYNINHLETPAILELGGNGFSGDFSGVYIWGRVLSSGDVASIYNSILNSVAPSDSTADDPYEEYMDWVLPWGWGDMTSGAYDSRISGSRKGERTCLLGYERVREANNVVTCNPVKDKYPALVENCPSDVFSQQLNAGERTTNLDGLWDSGVIFGSDSSVPNFDPGNPYTPGRYLFTYNAFDSARNRASCKFEVFVPLSNCEDKVLPADQTQCTSEAGCSYPCENGFSFTTDIPSVQECDSSGVYNTQEPLISYYIPQCGRCDPATKQHVTISFTYNVPGITSIDSSSQTAINNLLLSLILAFSNMVTPKFCFSITDCADLLITTNIPGPEMISVQVTTTTAIAIETTNGIKMVDNILEYVLLDNSFNIASEDFGNGVTVDEETFVINSAIACEGNKQAREDTSCCVGCPEGQYYNSTTSLCVKCPLGEWNNQREQATCVPCGDGKTTETIGSTLETECIDMCLPGNYYDDTTSQCQVCAIGYYQPSGGQTFCFRCDVGKTTRLENATSVDECYDSCVSGTQLTASGECEECEVGRYRVQGQSSSCLPCNSNFTTSGTGKTDPDECNIRICPAGSQVHGVECEVCPLNTYSSTLGVENCTACPENTRTDTRESTSIDNCMFFCPAGKYVNGTSCLRCERDFYKVETDYYRTDCEPCPDERPRTAGMGAISSDECRYGNCGTGEVVDPNNPASCISCGYDTYQSNPDPVYLMDNCTACPENTATEVTGANSSVQCIRKCPSGLQLIDDDCVVCPRGFYKNNAANPPMSQFEMCSVCDSSFITEGEGSTTVAACNVGNCSAGERISGSGCVPCPVGQYNPDRWQTECTSCAPESVTNHTGAVSSAECNIYPNRTILQAEVSFDILFNVLLLDTTSSVFMNFQAILKINFLALFRTIDSFRDDEVTISNIFTRGSTNVIVSGQFEKDANAKADLIAALAQQIGLTVLNGVAELPLVADQNVTVLEDAQENPCGAGQFKSTSTLACEACPIGSYMPFTNAVINNVPIRCIVCEDGFSTSGTGSEESTDCKRTCDAGQEDPGTGVCTPCVANYRKLSAGVEACTACNVGTATVTYGSDRMLCRKPCVAGFYSPDVVDPIQNAVLSCVECPLDQYNEADNSLGCSNCPNGSATSLTASNSSSLCKNKCELDPGYCNNGQCEINGNGYSVTCTCDENYIGETCDVRTDPSENNQIMIIAAAVGGVLGLLLLVLIIVAICRGMRSMSSPSLSQEEKAMSSLQQGYPVVAPAGSIMMPTGMAQAMPMGLAQATYDPSIASFYPGAATNFYPNYAASTFNAAGPTYDNNAAFTFHDDKDLSKENNDVLYGSNAYTLQSSLSIR